MPDPTRPLPQPRRRTLGMLRSLRLRAVLVVLLTALWPVFVLQVWQAQADQVDVGRTLLLVLPVALVLAWWLGWRMVRPVEKLRDQVLAKLDHGLVAGDLDLGRGDEFGELADAFNELLARLDERGRANERFAAEIAHEMKNPLAALRATGDSLSAGAQDAARAARLARVIHDSSRRLDQLVTEVLELAHAEATMVDEPREPFDLAQLVNGLLDSHAQDERWAGCRFDYAGPVAAPVVAVPQRIETALRNLLANAASFAGPAGTVRVRVEWSERVVVAVEDDGPGIADEHLPKLFDRFFTTRTGRGTGLGLTMVRAIAEAHGGQVEAQNIVPHGARFSLTLTPMHG